MWITEEKLLQWSTQESTDLSSNAYNLIRDKLNETEFVSTHDFDIYLQGSYANSTNIKRDSDVDIVLQLNSEFFYDDSRLSEYQKQKRHAFFQQGKISFADYKLIIYNQLADKLRYLSRFKQMEYGAKSIKISLQNPSINVDVVPCFQYRNYHTFSENNPFSNDNYFEGISFNNTENNDFIINYPKLHKANGEDKNRNNRADGKFKQSVRAIKKIRNILEENRYLKDSEIPSYFIENLIFNVPDNQFDCPSLMRTFNNIVTFLNNSTILNSFVCQHKQWPLFGSRSTQWNIPDAKKIMDLLSKVKQGDIL